MRLKSLSLSQKLLGGLLAISLAFTATGTVAAYVMFRDRAEQMRVADLKLYVEQRTKAEQAVFEEVRTKHLSATRALAVRLESQDPKQAVRDFDRFFPLQADGTRRGSGALAKGVAEGGDRLYGLTAFIGDGARVSDDDKRLMMAMTYVIRASGEADRSGFDNFYYAAPSNRLIMFTPDHPEKISFYNHDAPATFSVGHVDLVNISLPQNNPTGATGCTRLTPLLTDRSHKSMVSACVTPIYLQGRYVGAWADTMQMGSHFLAALRDTVPGATNLIIDEQGSLIAYPGFVTTKYVTAPAIHTYETKLKLRDVAKVIRAQNREYGVVTSPDGRDLVAYGHIDARWYFLMTLPHAVVDRAASVSALPLLVIGLFGAMAQAALILLWARSLFVKPLEQLVEDAKTGGQGAESARLEARHDEIGELARALTGERERTQELTNGLEDRVRERTAELDRANQAKSSFLATMSHELRTPLNGVVALSHLLAERQTTPEDKEMAALIISSGRLLEQVLTDILDFSKIEAGQLSLDEAPFELEVCVRRVAALHRAAAEAKGLALSWHVDENAVGGVLGDELRITQVLSNFLSNAVKFTEHGQVSLEVSRNAEGVLFAVRDTGIGFAPDVGQRLFQRFEQADVSITRRFGGTGLGLAICASLAQLMGGRVWAESEPGVGSAFYAQLVLPELCLLSDGEADTAQDDSALLAGARVLLAEDHPVNQRVVALILEPLGVVLTTVGDGAEAIEAEAAGNFDLILMDLHMPRVDGLSATRAIRAAETARGSSRTPIVALTADALAEHVAATRAAGADHHLAKPIRPEALVDIIAEILAADPRRSAAA
ncbi:ATP-binding protein [Phenylobacterium sp.]|uniref:ATP-binding protein n=1 Tax=Phenylobacterium sp. TaxID=1871053 RepID=UPI00122485D4|nr:ATP-binding protein [Phenylobacterium sp.]THD62989.1 MAG: response regulator [Phenylobacterium sp.]